MFAGIIALFGSLFGIWTVSDCEQIMAMNDKLEVGQLKGSA